MMLSFYSIFKFPLSSRGSLGLGLVLGAGVEAWATRSQS